MADLSWAVDQAITADPDRNDGHDANGVPGDCMRAALATLLGDGLEETPHVATFDALWFDAARAWVRSRRPGYDLGSYAPVFPVYGPTLEDGAEAYVPPHVILAGPSPRGPWGHVVIGDQATGDTLHDPHPSRAGLTEVEAIYCLVGAYDPPPAELPHG